MADVRLAAAALALGGRSSFSLDELLLLADSESSSGATECTPVVVRADGARCATATWSSAVGFQPVSAFPEPGLLEWTSDGSVMMERAPSGAYMEEWHLLPESRGHLARTVVGDGSEWFRTGSVGVFVRDLPGRRPRLRGSPTEHSTIPGRVGATVRI